MGEDNKNEIDRDLVEAVASRVVEKLESKRNIDDSLHDKHHRFIDMLITEREESVQLRKELRKALLKWGIIGVLGFLIATSYQDVMNHIHAWVGHNGGGGPPTAMPPGSP